MKDLTVGSEKILLCATGLSPQVVTETVYALAVEKQWVPTSVQIITTAEGAHRARLSLLAEGSGWLDRLCEDYQLPSIRFTKDDILVLKDSAGEPVEDIKTFEDNERAANFIVEQVRRLTSMENSELHVSIAGGRKNMGFYLGYALSLFGRARDRLSHVLVSAPYESCWDFFYPTPNNNIIQTSDNNLADTKDAKINLVEIPFVSLRHGMADDMLHGRTGFADAVDAVSASLAPPELKLDLRGSSVEISGKRIRLTPVSLALLSTFARRKMLGKSPLNAPIKEVRDMEWAERYLREYRQVKDGMADTDTTERALRRGMDGGYFSSCKSRLHRELKDKLGAIANEYLIEDGGKRPRQYSLSLLSEFITYQQ